MNSIEFVCSKMLLKIGIIPFILTIVSVLIIIVVTIVLVYRELKGKSEK